MSAIALLPDLQDTIFIKTDKGRSEVSTRSAGLKSRQRSVLIMLDGQKSLRDVAGRASDELAEAAARLLALELIAPVSVTGTAAQVPAGAAPEPIVDTAPSAKLAGIKALMTDSANTYLGLMAADVVRRVQRARDEAELLAVVGHWHMAMRDSKHGRDAAEAFLERIRAGFGNDATTAVAA